MWHLYFFIKKILNFFLKIPENFKKIGKINKNEKMIKKNLEKLIYLEKKSYFRFFTIPEKVFQILK